MRLSKIFTEHPASVGETYAEHLGQACGFGVRMIIAGVACVVHAVLPFVFVRTASDTVLKLHDCMIARRDASRRRAAKPGSRATHESIRRAN